MLEKEDYDDGSYGPVFVRLAWHASGTYDKNTNTGGSNGATMRCVLRFFAAGAAVKRPPVSQNAIQVAAVLLQAVNGSA